MQPETQVACYKREGHLHTLHMAIWIASKILICYVCWSIDTVYFPQKIPEPEINDFFLCFWHWWLLKWENNRETPIYRNLATYSRWLLTSGGHTLQVPLYLDHNVQRLLINHNGLFMETEASSKLLQLMWQMPCDWQLWWQIFGKMSSQQTGLGQ